MGSISTFSVEVICKSEAPYCDETKHNPLPKSDQDIIAMYLIEKKMGCEGDRQERPYTIYPWIIFSGDIEDKDEGTKMEYSNKGIFNGTCLAIGSIWKVGGIVDESEKLIHG